MASKSQKLFYVAHDDLREKYRKMPAPGDVIRSFCRSVAQSTQTTIESRVMPNGTVRFELIGGKGGVNRAKGIIVGQFCKERTKGKYIDAPTERVIKSSQEAMKVLPEAKQQKLLEEGNHFLLTEAALNKFNLLSGASELREFACAPCDNIWWRVVPKNKPVSRCKKCSERYDALPRDKEYGIGRYLCTKCGHSFNKRCTATDTFYCYECKSEVRTPYIHPKFLSTKPPPPKPQQIPPPLKFPQPTPVYEPPVLVPLIRPLAAEPPNIPYEPKSTGAAVSFKKKKVVHASTLHESTGSTISTILTQNEDLGYEFMTMSDSDSEGSKSDDEDYPTSTASSEPEETTDTEGYSDTEALLGSDSDSEHTHPTMRKRVSASDTESDVLDSDIDDDSLSKMPAATGSDSGIGTASDSRSSSNTPSTSGSYASIVKGRINPLSSIDVRAEFPGVIFSKHCSQQAVDREGATIEGEGISLTVPEGAVPSTDEVEISLQGCLGGPFVPPEGYTFASPVYLISPPFVFHKEVVLRIDHFACLETQEDCQEMIFISSPTKLKPPISDQGEPCWHFHEYHRYGNPRFTPHSGCGEIRLKHFCFGAFARRKKKGLTDWYSVGLHTPVACGLSLCHAIFSVTLHHKVFTENLQRYLDRNFPTENFRPVYKRIRSDKLEEEIELDIPREVVKDQQYRIVPDIDPCKITKDEIDYPRECKKRAVKDIATYPPRIVLKIRTDQPSLELECPLEVTGIAPSIRFNLLVNSPQSDYSSQSSVEGSTCSGKISSDRNEDKPLSMKHLHKISKYLKLIPKSELIRLGGELGLCYTSLQNMNMMPEDMVAAWIRGEEGSREKGIPSWRTLVNALEETEQAGTARNIQTEQYQ